MYKIYIVGGYVRDKLLNIDSKDIDFCFVIEDPKVKILDEGYQIMKKYLVEEGFTIFLEKESMVTLRARFPKDYHLSQYTNKTADFVLSRKEISYSNTSRHPELEIGSLWDDLIRRDFTVNSMAQDLDGNIIDFFNGKEDLKNKILKTPIDPLKTMLDDPLRLLRALRFSITKDFKIDEKLYQAMIDENVINKLFLTVSQERIKNELHKMFSYSTTKSLEILNKFNNDCPNFINRIFSNNMWLIPTTKKN